MDSIDSEIAYHIRQVERRRRARVVMIALPALLATLLWLAVSALGKEYFVFGLGIRPEVLMVMVVLLYAMSGMTLILMYLQTGFKPLPSFEFESRQFQEERSMRLAEEEVAAARGAHEFEKRVAELEAALSETREAIGNLDAAERASIVDDLRASLQHETAASVLAELRNAVEQEQERASAEIDLTVRLDDSRNRIQKELEALGWRGNLNLSLGAITTVIGISLLGISVFSETKAPTDMMSLAAHFVPRLTLVLLIELFAFFFLSLYKNSLSEIKYFQNEITNIECWQSALRIATHDGGTSLLAGVVTALSATERNHVLAKGETTIELEKARIEQRSQSSLAKALVEAVRGKA
jgi:hypothetical protein